jgi:hypothetical protein
MGIFNKSEPSGTAPVINAGAPQPGGNNTPGKPAEPAKAPGTPAQPHTAKPDETRKV